MAIVFFEQEHLVATPWKNGGGTTREIVRMPAGSSMESFDWRTSIAEISRDGPFSTFLGVDRALVLLSGEGVQLRSPDRSIERVLDEPLVPFEFAGESRIDASLIGGASSDFNIMTRRSTTRAEMKIVVVSQALAACSAGVLFAACGNWEVRSVDGAPRVFSLGADSGVWWSGESVAWKVEPRVASDALIAVRIE